MSVKVHTATHPNGNIYVSYWCSGCEEYHSIRTGGTAYPRWDFNGDVEKPTFQPSIKVDDSNGTICHHYVVGGKIQYLDDCRHTMKSQTVELRDFTPSQEEPHAPTE